MITGAIKSPPTANRVKAAALGLNGPVSIDKRARCNPLCVVITVLATCAGIVLSNALVCNSFGMAWARAVADESGSTWSSNDLDGALHREAKGWLLSMITCGLLVAAVQGRWLINGVNFETALVFAGWVAFAVAAFLPLVLFNGIDYLKDIDEAKEQCAVLRTHGNWLQKNSCEFKWASTLISTSVFSVVILFQTGRGFFKYCCNAATNSDTAHANAQAVEKQTSFDVSNGVSSRSAFARGHLSHSFFDFNTARADDQRQLLSLSPTRTEGALPEAPPVVLTFKLPLGK